MPPHLKIRECFGCRIAVRQPKFYEGDEETPWCEGCFVTSEQLEELKKTMPCWASLVRPASAEKKKIRLVSKATPPTSHTAAAPSAAVADAPPKDSPKEPPVVQKKKPVLLKKVREAAVAVAPVAVAVAVAEPAAAPLNVAKAKKKPVLLKKPQPPTSTHTAPGAPVQSS